MCLALGGTWKPDDKDMIGRFGEGLKLTALALVRENSEDKVIIKMICLKDSIYIQVIVKQIRNGYFQ